MASATPNPGTAFGAWLREQRTVRGEPIRVVAAAAEMDQAALSKIELGKRWPTGEQVAAFAKHFGVEYREVQKRMYAARMWAECGPDNPELAIAVAEQVQEDAAEYGVNKSVSNVGKRR